MHEEILSQIIPPAERINREISLETTPAPLDLKALFGNDHPLELEIGIGKGLYMLNAALERPEHNFIGIEIRRKYLRMARERVEKRPITNVRYVCGEAFSFIEKFLTPNSLQTLHIYFPDPWPKKRHHKRRLLSADFLKLVDRVLVPGGKLLIATDHAGYWEHINEVLTNQEYLVRCDAVPTTPEGAEGLTNYEIKYTEEGRPIYRVGYRKPNV